MKQAGIPTAVHYPIPLNKQSAVADAAVQLPRGDEAAEQVISLPMHPYLSKADQQTTVTLCRDHILRAPTASTTNLNAQL